MKINSKSCWNVLVYSMILCVYLEALLELFTLVNYTEYLCPECAYNFAKKKMAFNRTWLLLCLRAHTNDCRCALVRWKLCNWIVNDNQQTQLNNAHPTPNAIHLLTALLRSHALPCKWMHSRHNLLVTASSLRYSVRRRGCLHHFSIPVLCLMIAEVVSVYGWRAMFKGPFCSWFPL